MSSSSSSSPDCEWTLNSIPARNLSGSLVAQVAEGIGLHSGLTFRVVIEQAAQIGQGIIFRYFHEGVEYSAPAHWLRVSGTSRSTALVLRGNSRRRFELSTVEHFLSAALVAGCHDLNVEIQCAKSDLDVLEMPVLDGAALAWYTSLQPFQRSQVNWPREGIPCWKLVRSVEVIDERKRVTLTPLMDSEKAITQFFCEVDFRGIWKQSASLELDWTQPHRFQKKFYHDVAPARTFGFQDELEMLEKRGLARGANLQNAILLKDESVVNEGGLRFSNEIAAHKLLDAMGDLFLMGAPFLGRADVREAGHSMHVQAVKEAFRQNALVKGFLSSSGVFTQQ